MDTGVTPPERGSRVIFQFIGRSQGAPMLAGHGLFAVVVLIAAASAVTDILYRKIYNWVTLPAILLGILVHTLVQGWSGTTCALTGFAVGFGFPLLLYLVGALGGGDVKLLGAIGACVGWPLIFWAIGLTFIAGLALALGAMAWRGEVRLRLGNIWRLLKSVVLAVLYPGYEIATPTKDTGTLIPFGVAIFFGAVWALVAQHRLLQVFPG